jgi:hypothetical protein
MLIFDGAVVTGRRAVSAEFVDESDVVAYAA